MKSCSLEVYMPDLVDGTLGGSSLHKHLGHSHHSLGHREHHLSKKLLILFSFPGKCVWCNWITLHDLLHLFDLFIGLLYYITQARFFFVGPPDVPLFLFCLDFWVASLRSWCRTGAKMEGKSLFKARPAWDATGEVVIGQDDTSHGFGGANVRTKWRHNKDKPTLWWIYLGHRRICWKSRPCGPQRRSLENWNPGWECPQAWLMRNSQSPG